MLDFTSALYLGLQHPHAALESWDALTLGRPAALREPPAALQLARELARLQGAQAATLLPSTLHLFWDLVGMLSHEPVTLLCDAGVYPIARWALTQARGLGVPVHEFAHHDVAALQRLARLASRERRRPVVIADGYCTGCAASAPVMAYADIARRHGGYLIIDDTQALGVLGSTPSTTIPYGCGGGGSLRWHGVSGEHILIVSSLAKAFGAPLAVLAGGSALIERFVRTSKTRIHCSPPSLAAIHAAQHALRINHAQGDVLRARLMGLVLRLRRVLLGAGLTPLSPACFPVQTFTATHALERMHRRLERGGVRALLTRLCRSAGTGLTFIVTARHAPTDIADLMRRLAPTTAEFARAS